MRFAQRLALPAALLLAGPADADVLSSGDGGFAVSSTVTVAVDRSAAWAMLLQPNKWWSKDHTFSGNAANLSLEAKAGGCFCEIVPGSPAGSVRHLTVIQARPSSMLRLSGALGPLQSEALSGTLTIDLKPAEGVGTVIVLTYVVGGYSRTPLKQVAPAVDQVLRQQLEGLAAALKRP